MPPHASAEARERRHRRRRQGSWDDTAKQVNAPGTGRYPIGTAIEAAGNGVTTVRVRLDGSRPRWRDTRRSPPSSTPQLVFHGGLFDLHYGAKRLDALPHFACPVCKFGLLRLAQPFEIQIEESD